MKTKLLTLSPLAAGILLWSAGSVTQAQATDFLDQSTLTGDWGGYRTQLKNDGVTFTGEYVSETAGILHGGERNGTRYAQQVKIGAAFDLDRMFDADHAGTIQILINDRRGKSASNDLVGNRLPMQEDYGGEYTRLSEFSYTNWLLTPKLTYKVGFMAMGNDFGGMPILSNFVNAGFDAHPLSLSGGSGWGNYPTAHFGGEIRYDFDSGWSVHTAIFDVNPSTNTASSKAFKPITRGTTGSIIPVEAIYAYRGALPGLYKFGYYHDTSKVARIGDSQKRTARNGGYVLGDQTVWQSSSLKSQNLHVFGQWTTADTRSSAFHHWYSAGLVLNGPFESRPKDSIAIGYGRAVYNKKSRDADIDSMVDAGNLVGADEAENLSMAEKLVELSYNVQATPWLSVRPSLQYDKDPGTFSNKKITDAWVAAIQLKIEL